MLDGRPEEASGAVVSCSFEGTRPILLEVQALVTETNFGMPRRTAAGTDYNLSLIHILNLWSKRPLDKDEMDAVRAAYIRQNLPEII